MKKTNFQKLLENPESHANASRLHEFASHVPEVVREVALKAPFATRVRIEDPTNVHLHMLTVLDGLVELENAEDLIGSQEESEVYTTVHNSLYIQLTRFNIFAFPEDVWMKCNVYILAAKFGERLKEFAVALRCEAPHLKCGKVDFLYKGEDVIQKLIPTGMVRVDAEAHPCEGLTEELADHILRKFEAETSDGTRMIAPIYEPMWKDLVIKEKISSMTEEERRLWFMEMAPRLPSLFPKVPFEDVQEIGFAFAYSVITQNLIDLKDVRFYAFVIQTCGTKETTLAMLSMQRLAVLREGIKEFMLNMQGFENDDENEDEAK